jgi:hypothetical protein
MKIKNKKDIVERIMFLDLDIGDLFRCANDDALYMVMEPIESVDTDAYNCVCLNDGSVYGLNIRTEVIPITDYEFIVKE